MGREEGGGFRMGNTCMPVADSFSYLAKLILSFLRLHPSTIFWTPFDYDVYSISSKGFLPTVVDIMVI